MLRQVALGSHELKVIAISEQRYACGIKVACIHVGLRGVEGVDVVALACSQELKEDHKYEDRLHFNENR